MVRFARMPGSRKAGRHACTGRPWSGSNRAPCSRSYRRPRLGAPIDVSAQAGGNGGNQSSPTVAIDRYDPQKLVSVWVTTDPTLPPND